MSNETLLQATLNALFDLSTPALVVLEDTSAAIRRMREGAPTLVTIDTSVKDALVGMKPSTTVRAVKTKTKTKRKAKGMDPAAVLATKKGPKLMGNDNASAPDQYAGLTKLVVDALMQTTGKVTSVELAEILEKPTQKVSECLSGGFKRGTIKGLKREPGKSTSPSGKMVATYLYWLEGK